MHPGLSNNKSVYPYKEAYLLAKSKTQNRRNIFPYGNDLHLLCFCWDPLHYQICQYPEELSDKLKQIRAQEEFGKDDAYVESVARAQLDMVYPGEVIFRVTGEKYN